jgi:hypothetical protein
VLGLLAALVLIFPLHSVGLSMDALEPAQLRWAFGSALALAACCFASAPVSPITNGTAPVRPGEGTIAAH